MDNLRDHRLAKRQRRIFRSSRSLAEQQAWLAARPGAARAHLANMDHKRAKYGVDIINTFADECAKVITAHHETHPEDHVLLHVDHGGGNGALGSAIRSRLPSTCSHRYVYQSHDMVEHVEGETKLIHQSGPLSGQASVDDGTAVLYSANQMTYTHAALQAIVLSTLRVLKPGGQFLAFNPPQMWDKGSRYYHLFRYHPSLRPACHGVRRWYWNMGRGGDFMILGFQRTSYQLASYQSREEKDWFTVDHFWSFPTAAAADDDDDADDDEQGTGQSGPSNPVDAELRIVAQYMQQAVQPTVGGCLSLAQAYELESRLLLCDVSNIHFLLQAATSYYATSPIASPDQNLQPPEPRPVPGSIPSLWEHLRSWRDGNTSGPTRLQVQALYHNIIPDPQLNDTWPSVINDVYTSTGGVYIVATTTEGSDIVTLCHVSRTADHVTAQTRSVSRDSTLSWTRGNPLAHVYYLPVIATRELVGTGGRNSAHLAALAAVIELCLGSLLPSLGNDAAPYLDIPAAQLEQLRKLPRQALQSCPDPSLQTPEALWLYMREHTVCDCGESLQSIREAGSNLDYRLAIHKSRASGKDDQLKFAFAMPRKHKHPPPDGNGRAGEGFLKWVGPPWPASGGILSFVEHGRKRRKKGGGAPQKGCS